MAGAVNTIGQSKCGGGDRSSRPRFDCPEKKACFKRRWGYSGNFHQFLKGWLLRKHRLQESPSLSPRIFIKNPEHVGQVELPTRVGERLVGPCACQITDQHDFVVDDVLLY